MYVIQHQPLRRERSVLTLITSATASVFTALFPFAMMKEVVFKVLLKVK